jgi:hypothetical protein
VFDLEQFCKLIRLIQGVQEELNELCQIREICGITAAGGGGGGLSLVQCDSNDRRLTCVVTHQDGKPTDSSDGQAAINASA